MMNGRRGYLEVTAWDPAGFPGELGSSVSSDIRKPSNSAWKRGVGGAGLPLELNLRRAGAARVGNGRGRCLQGRETGGREGRAWSLGLELGVNTWL